MPRSSALGCAYGSGNNPSISYPLNPIKYFKRKEIRQEWFGRIKRGQNEKYLPKDSTLYICLEHFEIYEIHCKIYTLLYILYTKFYKLQNLYELSF